MDFVPTEGLDSAFGLQPEPRNSSTTSGDMDKGICWQHVGCGFLGDGYERDSELLLFMMWLPGRIVGLIPERR